MADGPHLDEGALARFLAGQLGPDEQLAAEVHLAGCDACAERLGGAPGKTIAAGPEPTRTASEERATPKERGESIGRYVVVDRLGEGGMGVVYAAYDPELDRRVAIKLVRTAGGSAERRKEHQLRLMREAQAMAKVVHPNVVTVHDVGPFEGGVFVAMEFVDGRTLKAELKARPHSWRETLELFVQAGRGLAAAHAAGLIHRDFKPDNVLIGKDGRVAVTDFGLARLTEGGEATRDGTSDREITHTSSSVALSEELTRAGTVMGTPNYMPPEQAAGEAVDARSDQFSFSAALYWALFGVRPFDPAKLHAYARSRVVLSEPRDTEGLVRAPPAEPKVPAWLRRAVMRGLSIDPGQRHGSMRELLDLLERRLRAPRRGWAIATAVVAFTAAGGYVVVDRTARAEICSGGPARLAGQWDERMKAAVRSGFLASGAADAQAQFDRTATALDAYAAGWAAMHKESCEATRIRREQSEELFTRRMLCLEQRLKELGTLSSLFAAADAKLVGRAPEVALALSSLRACADVTSLAQVVPPPEDPKALAEVERIGQILAEAAAIRLAGNYAVALQKAQTARQAADAIGYRPTQASAAYLEGTLLERTAKIAEGEQTMVQAIALADTARDDVLKARAAAYLVYAMAQRSRFTEAHHWATLARAALERTGGNAEVEGQLNDGEGSLLLREGKNAEALQSFLRAAKAYEVELGREHPRSLSARANAAAAQLELGKLDEAIAILEEVTATIVRRSGPTHASLSTPLANLAHAQLLAHNYGRAHQVAEQSIAVTRARFGEDHPALADAYDLQGLILHAERQYAPSLAAYERALAIKQRTLPPGDPDLAYSYDGIGQAQVGMGRTKEGIATLRRALELRGTDPGGRAETTFALAQALWTTGDKSALDHARRAQALFQQAARKEDEEKVTTWLAGK